MMGVALKRKAILLMKALKKLFPRAEIALQHSSPWQLLVAVILSAQTTDKKVNEVTGRLFKKYKALNDYVKANLKEFAKDIGTINFYRNKASNILKTAKIIKEKYGGAVPRTIDELTQLPGVGRKTANIILGSAFGIVEGIAVDTHVKRLSRLFGLTENGDPEKIEKDLMSILPKRYWLGYSCLLINYGRKYCPARHIHLDCPLRAYIIK